MNLRPGTPDDTEAAVSVRDRAKSARLGLPEPAPGEDSPTRRYIEQPDSFLIVAEDEAEVVGMSLGMQAIDVDGDGADIPGLCHVSAIFVAPERWGEGIGKGLVDAVMAEARSQGYVRAQLWTDADNVRAQRLYEGRSFRRSGRTTIDERGEEIVHYERRL